MKMRNFKYILAFWIFAAGLAAISCNPEGNDLEQPYLNVDNTYSDASGEGDGFIVNIRTNLSWTISAVDDSGAEADWIKFDKTSGTGDADVLAFVLRGSRSASRACNIVVTAIDEDKTVSIPFNQSMFVPELRKTAFASVITSGYPLAEGDTGALQDYAYVQALVTGVPGDNLPDGYVFITDDGTWAVKVKTSLASSLKVGDKVQVELTEGTITKESAGGYTIEVPNEITVLSSGNDVPVAHIQSSAVARYENALVSVDPCQAQESYVGKTWSGTVGLEAYDNDYGTFAAEVDGGASFASSPIASGSGSVKGIVIDGKIHPRDAGDLSLTSGERISATSSYKIKPVLAFFQLGSAANNYINGEITGNTKFTFTASDGFSVEGAAVEKVTGEANVMTMVAGVAAPFQSCCTIRQWQLAGSYLLYTVPVTQEIYGDLDFNFSISCGTPGVFASAWSVLWSTDNSSWKKVDAVYGGSNMTKGSGGSGEFTFTQTAHDWNRMVAEISIPESEKISSGNLYFKLVPPTVTQANATKTLRVNAGFFLCSRADEPSDGDWDNVLASESFADAVSGCCPVVGTPTYYLANYGFVTEYSGSWSVSGANELSRGCLRLSAASGENYLLAPVLESLTGTADIVVSFKAAPFVNPNGKELAINANNISVSCSGGGTAEEIVWDNADFVSDPYNWHHATVKIKGASLSTSISIGNLDAGASAASFYIDDVVISR